MLKNPGVFGAWDVSEMSRFDEFREANERYAPVSAAEIYPYPRVAVMTCMDARLRLDIT
jgi:carbonic anhydrase